MKIILILQILNVILNILVLALNYKIKIKIANLQEILEELEDY